MIPGKPAPKLLLEEHVHLMKPGSVIVDLAAETGGNCVVTKPGEVNVVNGVKIVGYTDFPSRLAGQSSALYANNITKFFQQILVKDGKTTTNLEDEIARGAVITDKGQLLWPNPNPPNLDAGKAQKKVETKKKEVVTDLFNETVRTASTMGAALASIVGVGMLCPDPSFMTMFSTFSLAVIAGYQSVWGVSPALHTPLMSITNAISGITAVGGLLLLGGGYLPHTIPQILAATAVLASTVNITGGFIVTKRMLDMFKRPTDPKEHNYLYSIPAVAGIGSLLAAHMAGVPNIYQMGYLFSSLLCIGGISGLSAQKTARIGNAMGIIGVAGGVVTALSSLHLSPAVFT